MSLLFCSANAADIQVNITGIDESKGSIIVELYSSSIKENFPMPGDAIERKVKADTKGVTVVFKDVSEGEHAISMIHDVNSNNEMDTSFLGIPQEPYGNSGEYTNFKPNYEDSKFIVKDKNINLTIEVH